MIITNLKGGLGNQMFQYACGYALAKEYNTRQKIDLSFYKEIPMNNTKRYFELSSFNTLYEIANKSEIEKLKGTNKKFLKYYRNLTSKAYTIFTDIYPIEKYLGVKNLYLDGYFQSEKFFIKYRDDFLREFILKRDLETKEYKEVANKINIGKNTISIHIRRGDYVIDIKTAKHHGILDVEYYKKALAIINIKNPNIYVFSDDIDWVRENFKFLPRNTYFVSKHKFTSAQEITLMSLCKHNIIANSSFSWWGAWLNKNEDKIVIAPKKWTKSMLFVNKSITPKDWYRI